MKNTKRTLIIGVVWGILFFLWWLKGFLYENWRFDLFSYKSWRYLTDEFVSGWTISSSSDWIFLFTLIIALPVFFYGWRILLKVEWRKTVQLIWTALVVRWRKANAPKKVLKIVAQKSHKKVRPRPLNRIARVEDTLSEPTMTVKAAADVVEKADVPTFSREAERAAGKSIAGFNVSEPAFMASPADEEEALPSGEPRLVEEPTGAHEDLEALLQIPPIEPLNEDAVSLLISNGYKVVKDAVVGGVPVDYVAIGAEKILVLMLDQQKGDWLADEERFNGEDPLWFSESSHRVSPIFQLVGAAAFLAQKVARKGYLQQVIPVFAESEGTLINAEDMEDTWKELGVLVCRTNIGGPETLASLTQTLPKSEGVIDAGDVNVIRDLF